MKIRLDSLIVLLHIVSHQFTLSQVKYIYIGIFTINVDIIRQTPFDSVSGGDNRIGGDMMFVPCCSRVWQETDGDGNA